MGDAAACCAASRQLLQSGEWEQRKAGLMALRVRRRAWPRALRARPPAFPDSSSTRLTQSPGPQSACIKFDSGWDAALVTGLAVDLEAQLRDLRSLLVREACLTLETLVSRLGELAFPLVEHLVPAMLELVASGNTARAPAVAQSRRWRLRADPRVPRRSSPPPSAPPCTPCSARPACRARSRCCCST